MYQCSFCILLLASHFYTVLRPDENQNNRNQTLTYTRPRAHGPSHLMLTSRKWHLSWVLFNLMWLMSFAVLPHYLIIKPNSYLAFWSWSAENLMPLPMITPFVMPCSKYRRDIIKLWDAIEQSYILRSSHREQKVNKNHWVLNVSAFCQRKFCVRLYFQRAENVFVGRSLNPNQLCCQNTIKTIWSPLLPPSTITVPF